MGLSSDSVVGLKLAHFVSVAIVALCMLNVVASSSYKYRDAHLDQTDATEHPCNRQCPDKVMPRICKYHFTLEHYYVLSRACYQCPFNQSDCFRPDCVPANGDQRVIQTVNRKLPGPSIEVCEGDEIEVTVDNHMMMGEGTSIHWHGILQLGTPFMDGVSQVTQCHINANTKFTYRFLADHHGTYFWHAHSDMQRSEGIFGPLILRQSPSRNPHSDLYDFDLSEHVIMVHDWVNTSTLESFVSIFHGSGRLPETVILVNGKAAYREFQDDEGGSVYTPRATFTVKQGMRYRFRVISSSVLNCPFQISIDGHNLTMISSDNGDFEPLTVESFTISNGERYDFVLNADNASPLRNFWIRFLGSGQCGFVGNAVLKYDGADDELPPEPEPTLMDARPTGRNLNVVAAQESDTNIPITRLRGLDPDEDLLAPEPDKKLYLSLDFRDINNPRYQDPVFYPKNSDASMTPVFTQQINCISFKFPSSPLLSQFRDTPQSSYCNPQTHNITCNENFYSCIHRYQLALGDLVEIVFFDSGKNVADVGHDMHLHGHRFRVLGIGPINSTMGLKDIIAMDARGQLQRATMKTPYKDTVYVNARAYTIIRFRANNPGFWMLHCHMEYHMQSGMQVVLQVGDERQIPATPKHFPTCGDWKPEK